MFESLSEKLEGALKSVTGQGRITELNVAQTMREIRRALLDADVNYQVAKDFTERVREKAMGAEVLTSVSPGQLLVKIVYDELVYFLGSENVGVEPARVPPTVILVAGLQGSGKTTFCGKLAAHFKAKGRAPMLAAADVYRPAAVDQLRTLATTVGVPVYAVEENGEVVRDAVRVAREAVAAARKNARDILIIDTAGRLHVDERMMDEVQAIKSAVTPHEILFVVDAMTGQDAVNTAVAFNERLDFSGVVLTKLDGDTRGGAALSIRSVVQKPIKFASTGEKLDALTPFYPDRMAQRILGMGDVISLVEKAQEAVDQETARRFATKMYKNEIDLQDFLEQIGQMEKMGPISQIVSMIPGMGQLMGGKEDDMQGEFRRMKAIIQSMTVDERRHPEIIDGSRRKRIARGSGRTLPEINNLLKQFKDLRKMMKGFGSGKFARMMGKYRKGQ